jgi:hypothetical protein
VRTALATAAALLAAAAPAAASETMRRLACRLSTSRVAIAGGRVLAERAAPTGNTRLVLLGPDGRRVLDRVSRRRAVGGFDLGSGRALWAVGAPSGYQRIHLERL